MPNQANILVTKPFEKICLVTLNRLDKCNALNGDLIQEWIEALLKISQDKNIAVVIFNGNGEHFCAGADIAWMKTMAERSHDENVQDARQLATLLKLIYDFPKPTIGLVQGACMGGGIGVIACCDMVIAAENSIFCFSEAKIGLTPSVISPYVLSVMGERMARYYFLTAEKFDAKKALQYQLVQSTVQLEKLFETGLTLAHTLLQNSPNALYEAKKIIKAVVKQPITEELSQMTAEHLATLRASKDAKEGLKAFLEKRLPIW